MSGQKVVMPGDIIVIGHRNPDTDTICSAIGYAVLKNKLTGKSHIACRAGELSAETAFVFRHFGLPVPPLCDDVSPQVQDIDIRKTDTFSEDITVHDAWEIMRDREISTLPVVAPSGRLKGIITLRDLAVAHMDSLDLEALSNARTPFKNIAKTLHGSIVFGDPDGAPEPGGRVIVGAGNPEAIKSSVRKGDVVLVSNRPESQIWAVRNGAACVVVGLSSTICAEAMRLAHEHGCTMITTPYDTFLASYFINQSVPIGYYLVRDNLKTFDLWTPVEDAVSVMSKTRFVYFPVLDNEGNYYGIVSRRNLLNLHRKRLILVDHNERQQAVHGFEDADILEIIDHHRVGGLQTGSPIYFRNQPVGSTATIVWELFLERGVEIPEKIAGLLCCAVLSDTLMFSSPTCTEKDRLAAKDLADRAGEDIDTLGDAMFSAGENLSGKSGKDLVYQDFKLFSASGITFAIGQSSFLSDSTMQEAAELVRPELGKAMVENSASMIIYMLTSIKEQSSMLMYEGADAEHLLHEAFGLEPDNGFIQLPGVVSRKKQVVPPIIEVLRRRDHS